MTLTRSGPAQITEAEFRAVGEFLHRRTGIRLSSGKETLVMSRLDKRLRHLGVPSYGEYLRLLQRPEHAPEARQAIDLLTTNETFFFREPQHFDFLRDTVVPAHRGPRALRVWSAASSSGEEAYTAAMVLAESMSGGAWEVVGTDISSRMVAGARAGVYPIAAAERIPRPLLRKYFLKGREEYTGLMAVDRGLRSRVTFRGGNLLEDLSGLGRFDVVFLRNVMIYFEPATKAVVIGHVQRMLNPGGYLIVSLAETLNGIPSLLRGVQPSIYQLPGAGRG